MIELVQQAWESLGPAHDFVLAILLSLVTAGMLALFRPRVRLIWGSTSVNAHQFPLKEGAAPVFIATEKLFVQNTGRKPALNVELILNDVPSSYSLWQPRDHQSSPMNGGGFSIRIPSIAPRELVIIDTIDVDVRNPKLVAVNCPDAQAKEVKFLSQRQFGRMVYLLIAYLMLAGVIGTFYLSLKLIFGA